MAHTRKDTLIKPTEHWKHLKLAKRSTAKKERKAGKKAVRIEGELL